MERHYTQSQYSHPHVTKIDQDSYSVWFTAYNDDNDEQEVCVYMDRKATERLIRDMILAMGD